MIYAAGALDRLNEERQGRLGALFLNNASPFLDAPLTVGSFTEVSIPPISGRGWRMKKPPKAEIEPSSRFGKPVILADANVTL
jgi:hypothetical protein